MRHFNRKVLLSWPSKAAGREMKAAAKMIVYKK